MTIRSLERFRPNLSCPEDFAGFWQETVAATACIDPEIVSGPPEAVAGGIELQRIRFRSLAGAKIHAYLARPVSGQPCPLIVHAHGYGDRYEVMLDWARRGIAVFGFDARGFGRSAQAAEVSEHGYVVTGIETPGTSILRGAVADYLQAVTVARRLCAGRATRMVCQGFSFGGALALMAAGLLADIDLVAVGQPTFGWHAERCRVARGGSTLQLNNFVQRFPQQRDRALATLEYFDTVHFAPLIRAPTLAGIGLDDDIVPSRTVLAIVNYMRCPLEVRLLPVSHSADPRESLWRDFHDEWLGYTVAGLPTGYGSANRQIRTLVA